MVVRSFVDAVNDKDWESLDHLVAPDFVRHSIAAGNPSVQSRAALIEFLTMEFLTFPDAHEEILDILEEGDRVAVRVRFRGTQAGKLGNYPPSDRQITSEYLAIYRLSEGQIVEAWAEWDNLATLKTVGHP